MVFTKNKEAERSILFIVLLPSLTTFGIDAKFESSKTNWETFFVASLPFAIAILQSAVFNAKTSFTPSPVIATVFPLFWRAITKSFFCVGLTLPKIVYFKAAFSKSLSDVIFDIST